MAIATTLALVLGLSRIAAGLLTKPKLSDAQRKLLTRLQRTADVGIEAGEEAELFRTGARQIFPQVEAAQARVAAAAAASSTTRSSQGIGAVAEVQLSANEAFSNLQTSIARLDEQRKATAEAALAGVTAQTEASLDIQAEARGSLIGQGLEDILGVFESEQIDPIDKLIAAFERIDATDRDQLFSAAIVDQAFAPSAKFTPKSLQPEPF